MVPEGSGRQRLKEEESEDEVRGMREEESKAKY